MSTALITKPAVEPVSLAEAKLNLRVDGNDEDTLIGELITAARLYLEQVTGVRLITQHWRQFEDCWPASNCLTLKLRPVRSVDAITIYDGDGVPGVVPAGDYQLDLVSEPARIFLPDGALVGQAMNGIEIDITAGFGDAGIDVPDTLKRALLMLVAHWYEFRGAVSPKEQPVSIPPGFEAVISPYKRRTL